MFGRVFFIFAGILSLCTILFFGFHLIHNRHTLSPETIFTKKDSKVLIINNLEEYKFSQINFKHPINETKLILNLVSKKCYSERLYISSLRNRIVIELKSNWNNQLVTTYFNHKKISAKQINNIYHINGGFQAEFSDKYLIIGKQHLEEEYWDRITWPVWDKLASCNILNLTKEKICEDYYFKPSFYTKYETSSKQYGKIKKVNDFDLFASVLPKGITNYHFISKTYALKTGKLTKQDLLYKWCDQGYVSFKIDGVTVLVSDFTPNIDPFDLLNDETEEEELVAGSKSEYSGIKLLSNFPIKENGSFYIKYLEDKVVFSESKEIVNQVLAYYETGRTIALTPKAKKSIYENLPSSVCERSISDEEKFTTTIAFNKHITVCKVENISSLNSELDKQQEREKTTTFTTDLSINHIIGSQDIQVCFAEGQCFGLKNGKKLWDKFFDGTIIGNPVCHDFLNNGNQHVLFTTNHKIHLIDLKGNSLKGFPITLDYTPSSEAVFFDSKNGKQLINVSSKKELINFNLQGKRLKTLKLSISPTNIIPFIFKDGKKNLTVISGKNGGQLIQLDNLSKKNSFTVLNNQTVFCATDNTPAFFYPDKGKLVRNDFTGKTTIVGSYSKIDLIRNLRGVTRQYVTYLTDKKFYVCDCVGKIICTIDLPSSNISDYQVLTLEDGSSIVGFIDSIENSIYLYSTKGNKITKNALEGHGIISLSETSDGILIFTKGNNLIIQYKIEL